MGWDWGHRPHGQTVKEYLAENLTWETEKTVTRPLDIAIVQLRTAYGAIETTHKDTGEREVWAYVGLLDYAPHDDFNQGKKDMDETMGPYEHNCPERIIKLLTPTDNEHANEWREKARTAIAERKAKAQEHKANPIEPGQEWEFWGNRLTVGGVPLRTLTVAYKSGRGWVCNTNGGVFKLQRRHFDYGEKVA